MSKKNIYNYDQSALEDYRKRDRRMMKFQGFFLSEHTEQQQQNLSKEKQMYGQSMKERQSDSVIAQKLDTLFQTKNVGIVQLDIVNSEKQFTYHIGKVLGLNENIIFLQTNHNLESIAIDLIRHVASVKNVKWFQ